MTTKYVVQELDAKTKFLAFFNEVMKGSDKWVILFENLTIENDDDPFSVSIKYKELYWQIDYFYDFEEGYTGNVLRISFFARGLEHYYEFRNEKDFWEGK